MLFRYMIFYTILILPTWTYEKDARAPRRFGLPLGPRQTRTLPAWASVSLLFFLPPSLLALKINPCQLPEGHAKRTTALQLTQQDLLGESRLPDQASCTGKICVLRGFTLGHATLGFPMSTGHGPVRLRRPHACYATL